jgi:8-oxo-dGTP pyrophosphatase MutT (NUDIX family)
MSPQPKKPPLEREFSAGGLVVRRMRGQAYVAVVHVKDGKVLALPKGHIDEGETGPEAAVREVREEAGVDGELVEKLGDIRYWYTRDGKRVLKVVSFFLLRYRSGSVRDYQREEVDGAEWLPLDEAPTRLGYKGERQMAEAALSKLEESV